MLSISIIISTIYITIFCVLENQKLLSNSAWWITYAGLSLVFSEGRKVKQIVGDSWDQHLAFPSQKPGFLLIKGKKNLWPHVLNARLMTTHHMSLQRGFIEGQVEGELSGCKHSFACPP